MTTSAVYRHAPVGRTELLAWLEQVLETRGRALLTGPAGVGKTELALAAAARAESRGETVLWLATLLGQTGPPSGPPVQQQARGLCRLLYVRHTAAGRQVEAGGQQFLSPRVLPSPDRGVRGVAQAACGVLPAHGHRTVDGQGRHQFPGLRVAACDGQ
ncbi:hypothetical protein [Streptomyces sp. NPDC006527]|uniref:hypothetical protein n=1 Tax=Streptomyces sp. NPDC006527 TaxID=3364749 RepID=UPI00367B00C7